MVDLNKPLIIQTMKELEGFSVEETEFFYKKRENLPDGAFCGPNRTYPAHDESNVKNSITKLNQFGKGKKPHDRILSCLKSKAQKMGIELNDNESVEESILKWYIEEYVKNDCVECEIK